MESSWPEAEIVGFDLETTGVDRFSDVPVSFAIVRVIGGQLVECVSSVVKPGRAIPPEASAIHGITDERARDEGVPLQDAIERVIDALVDATQRGVPVAGMRLDFDLTITDWQCQRLTGRGLAGHGWWGPVLDASVIDRRVDRFRPGRRTLVDLCDHYGVSIDHAHDASADAAASVNVLRAIAHRYPRLAEVPPPVIHRWQIRWHRDWAESYSQWRMRNGLDPLAANELEWPIAPPEGWPPESAVA